MRHLLCLFLMFIFGFSVSGQSYPDYSNITVDHFSINFADHTITAWVEPVKRGIKADPDKTYSWYSSNQLHTTQGGYSGKLLNGPYFDYYLNKNLKEKGMFTKGLQFGIWYSWYENGVLKSRVNYAAGEKNGPFFNYDVNGKLSETGSYKSGLLNGKFIKYSKEGSSDTTYYKKGSLYTPTKKPSIFKKLSPFKKKIRE